MLHSSRATARKSASSPTEKLMLAALAGGPPVVVVDSLGVGDGYVMTADGYVYGAQRENGLFGIARIKAGSGSKWEMVTTVDTATGEHSHYLPDVLPNGKVLFQVNFRDGRRAIAVGDSRTRRHSVLMPGVRGKWAQNGHLLYTTIDGKLWSVAFDQKSLKTTGTPALVAEESRRRFSDRSTLASRRTEHWCIGSTT
jgi:hypothetical protein